MDKNFRKEVEKSLFKGEKYKYEGYPQWYNKQLAKNEPIPSYKFDNNLQKAAFFYQKEAGKLHFANYVLNMQLSSVLREIQELNTMIAEAEENENSSADDKKKRIRRCANQIERNYVCPVPYCQKSYGTEGSMAQHMRLKHPGVAYVMADLNQQDPEIKEEVEEVSKKQVKKKKKEPKLE